MSEHARLTAGEHEVELPMVTGSEGEIGLDISKLRGQTKLVSLDPAYVNTAAAVSQVTFLDGDKGILRYRGYPIEQLAQQCDFIEVCYLLIFGELPTREQLDVFRNAITRHTMLHEDVRAFYGGFPRDAHPMATLSSVVNALSTFYQDSLDPHDQQQVEVSIRRILAKLPTIAAYSYCKSLAER